MFLGSLSPKNYVSAPTASAIDLAIVSTMFLGSIP